MVLPMRAHRWVALVVAGLWLGACGAKVTVFGGGNNAATGGAGGEPGSGGATVEPTPVGGAAEGGAGGEGGAGACVTAEDCGDVGDCQSATCEAGICVLTPLPAATACDSDDGDFCNGQGACVKANGKACDNNPECFSELCIDGVCCATECSGFCEACNVDGSFGTCAPETPGTDPIDECMPGVCDGIGGCVSGDPGVVTLLGQGDDEFAYDVAMDGAGNRFLFGQFDGDLTLGDTDHVSAGETDVFLVKLNSQGEVTWSKTFGDENEQVGRKIVIDSEGDVIVGGWFYGTLAFDSEAPLVTAAPDDNDAYLAKFDGDSGTLLWSLSMGAPDSSQVVRDIAVDSNDDVVVGGWFFDSIDMGSGTPIDSAGSRDIYLAKFAGSNGAYQNGWTFGDGSSDRLYGIALDSNDNMLFTGYFAGQLNIGGTVLAAGNGDSDVVLAKLTSNGTAVWAKSFGGNFDQYGRAVAVDSQDNVVIAGYYTGDPDFGGGALPNGDFAECFIAQYDSAGSHLWSSGFGEGGNQYILDVAVDSGNNVIATGYFGGQVNFGGEMLTAPGGDDRMLLAKFNGSGQHLWSASYGTDGDVDALGVAIGPNDLIAVAGFYDGSVDFGANETSSNGWDILAPTFEP